MRRFAAEEWVAFAGPFGYDRGEDAPEFVLEGLPAGDYRAYFHERVPREFHSNPMVEFSVR